MIGIANCSSMEEEASRRWHSRWADSPPGHSVYKQFALTVLVGDRSYCFGQVDGRAALWEWSALQICVRMGSGSACVWTGRTGDTGNGATSGYRMRCRVFPLFRTCDVAPALFVSPRQVLGQPRFLAVVLLALFSAAQLMFWKREVEARGAGEGERRGSGGVRGGEQS